MKFVMEDTETPAILSPSTIIDQVWHTHLMRPTIYNNFCHSCFGTMIDHDIAGSKSSEPEKQKRRRRTINMYKLIFKANPNPIIWKNHEASSHFEQNIELYVQRLSGKTLCLHVDIDNTINDLKTMIYKKEGIPLDQQRIIWDGIHLSSQSCGGGDSQDQKTFRQWNIPNQSTLQLVLRLAGC